jgi:ubiquinone/menaquinone biosynthesis C-methylase UbiE
MDADYSPFPSKPGRNARQEAFEIPLFVRLLDLSRHSRILEVGCGAGVALPGLQRLCSPGLVMGLDIDRNALGLAARRIRDLKPAIALVEADVRSIPVVPAYFDLVVDFGTCYHISRGEHAIREIERVLVPGGVFATETKLSQLLSHPFRSRGRNLHIHNRGRLRLQKHRGLWLSFEKIS